MIVEYPRSYKQFRIMEIILKEKGLTYTQIVKLAFELSHGTGTYSYQERGYWSGAFVIDVNASGHYQPGGAFVSSGNDYYTGWCSRLCDKENKLYKLNPEGLEIYTKLKEKFDGVIFNFIPNKNAFGNKYFKAEIFYNPN